MQVKLDAVVKEGAMPIEDDNHVEGTYTIELDDSISKELIADAAIDVFFNSVSIIGMNDFEYVVKKDGKVCEPMDSHERYDLMNKGHVVGMGTGDLS